MNKTYLMWIAILAFLLAGCRNETFNPTDAHSNQQTLKFRGCTEVGNSADIECAASKN